jgi:hypothetical protein
MVDTWGTEKVSRKAVERAAMRELWRAVLKVENMVV